MVCKNCGKTYSSGQFCIYCGTINDGQLEVTTNTTETVSAPEAPASTKLHEATEVITPPVVPQIPQMSITPEATAIPNEEEKTKKIYKNECAKQIQILKGITIAFGVIVMLFLIVMGAITREEFVVVIYFISAFIVVPIAMFASSVLLDALSNITVYQRKDVLEEPLLQLTL